MPDATKTDRLILFQEALSLEAEKHSIEVEDYLTPEEQNKFSRILKLMVFLDMTAEEQLVLH